MLLSETEKVDHPSYPILLARLAELWLLAMNISVSSLNALIFKGLRYILSICEFIMQFTVRSCGVISHVRSNDPPPVQQIFRECESSPECYSIMFDPFLFPSCLYLLQSFFLVVVDNDFLLLLCFPSLSLYPLAPGSTMASDPPMASCNHAGCATAGQL